MVEYELKQPSHPSTSGMLRELGLSRSNYYDWQKREVSAQQTKKNFVFALIQKIYDQNNGIYGAPMIAWEIRKQNISITVKTSW